MSQSAGAGVMDAYSHERRPWRPVLEYATMAKKKPAGPTADDVVTIIRQLPGSELSRLAEMFHAARAESADNLCDPWTCFVECVYAHIERESAKKWERLITVVADSWKGQAKGRDLFWVNLLKDIAAEAKSQTGKMHAEIVQLEKHKPGPKKKRTSNAEAISLQEQGYTEREIARHLKVPQYTLKKRKTRDKSWPRKTTSRKGGH